MEDSLDELKTHSHELAIGGNLINREFFKRV